MKALQKIWTPARTIGTIALVGTLALGACGASGAVSSGGGATSATTAVAAAGTNGATTAPPTAADALVAMAETLGGERPAALCRELTKTHEQVLRAPLSELVRATADGVLESLSGPVFITTEEGRLQHANDAALQSFL